MNQRWERGIGGNQIEQLCAILSGNPEAAERKVNKSDGGGFGAERDCGTATATAIATAIATAAPEPGSLALLLPVLGMVGMGIRKRRKA